MKSKNLYEIFEKIEKENIGVIFDLPDVIRNENLYKYRGLKKEIASTSQYFGTGRHEVDIETGRKFDVIFSKKNPRDYRKITSILTFVNVNPDIETHFLPAGYSGICMIDFPEGRPEEMIDVLCEFGEDKFGKDCEVLFLVDQLVMDRILLEI